MLGTIVNASCIIVGSTVGSFLKKGVQQKYQDALFTAIGVSTILMGANAFTHNMPKSAYPVLFIVSMALGSLIGYRLDLAGRFARLVDSRRSQDETVKNPLSEGLSTGILLFCIGTFSMVGPVMSALQGDNTYLFTNSTLDFITSMVLASTYGIGMIWAAPVLFCWQGMFYLIAKISESAISPDLMAEISIIGGILITASGLSILKIKDCKVINMLPAFLVPVLFFAVKSLLGL